MASKFGISGHLPPNMKPDAAVTGMAGLIWRIILIASNPFIFGKNRSQIGQIEWFFFDCANARRSIGRRGDHKAVGLKHNLGGGAHRRRVGTAEGSVIDAKGESRTVRRRASFSRTNASQDVNRNEISLSAMSVMGLGRVETPGRLAYGTRVW